MRLAQQGKRGGQILALARHAGLVNQPGGGDRGGLLGVRPPDVDHDTRDDNREQRSHHVQGPHDPSNYSTAILDNPRAKLP